MKLKIKDYTITTMQLVYSDKPIIAFEGGSRSGKTWGILKWILLEYFSKNKGKRVTVTREKLTWLKSTVLMDFKDICELYNIKTQPKININRADQTYQIWGNTISFIGIDERQKLFGRKQHISWINELIGEGTAYDITKKDFDQLNIRTIERMIFDYNPKAVEHWAYDKILSRNDCDWFKSTMLDNPFLEEKIISDIRAFEPTPENIENGTADPTSWKIYGLGERGHHEGLIFPNWKMVKEIPKEAKSLGIWIDLGFSINPTACGEIFIYEGELWVKEYFYETELTGTINKANPQQMSIEQRLIENNITKQQEIFMDTEGRIIRELLNNGWNIRPFKKPPKSVSTGISFLKGFKVNILDTAINIIKEKNSYKWKVHASTGQMINEPVKKNDHHIDGIRSIVYIRKLQQEI